MTVADRSSDKSRHATRAAAPEDAKSVKLDLLKIEEIIVRAIRADIRSERDFANARPRRSGHPFLGSPPT